MSGPGVVIGVDPGLRGGLARLEGVRVEVAPMPILTAGTKKGRDGKTKKAGRDQYDIPAIVQLVRRWSTVYSSSGPTVGVEVRRADVFVFVEKAIPFPPKVKAGSLAQFQRGVGRGWQWLLMALEIPHELVHPRTWQIVMHRGLAKDDKKQTSILAAQRYFPGVDLRRNERCKVPHDGIAEALLIAEYGRRTLYGEPKEVGDEGASSPVGFGGGLAQKT